MNKTDFVKIISSIDGVNNEEAGAAFDDIIAAVTGALVSGKKVYIDDIGTLESVTAAARIGRNPKTGESINIPEKQRIRFRASSTVKKAING